MPQKNIDLKVHKRFDFNITIVLLRLVYLEFLPPLNQYQYWQCLPPFCSTIQLRIRYTALVDLPSKHNPYQSGLLEYIAVHLKVSSWE